LIGRSDYLTLGLELEIIRSVSARRPTGPARRGCRYRGSF